MMEHESLEVWQMAAVLAGNSAVVTGCSSAVNTGGGLCTAINTGSGL